MQFLNKLITNIAQNQLVISRRILENVIQPFPCHLSTKLTIEIPEKPKRPPSAFLRFFMEVRPQLIQKHPEARLTDLTKTAAEIWRSSDENTKKSFADAYAKDWKSYTVSLNKYQSELTDDQKHAILSIARKKEKKQKSKELKKENIQLGFPKRPAPAFALYLMERKSGKNLPTKEWVKVLGNEWKNMPEEEKNVYVQKAKSLVEEYNLKLLKWRAVFESTNTDRKLPTPVKKVSSKTTQEDVDKK